MIALADTFAFIAWLNPRDRAHEKATAFLNVYDGKLITTEWILIELADALCSPESRQTAAEFLASIREDPGIEIVEFSASLSQQGLDLYASRQDKWWSLTDCISFVVMSERGIADALTADHHFEQAGIRALFK